MSDRTAEGFHISTDKNLLDLVLIHDFLSQESYWAKNVPLAVVEKSIANSLCFGIYKGVEQVGFARVVTDYATFAYLADVFVVRPHRGLGLSKRLVATILQHPDLQGLRRWLLATQDAHGLYAQFGFEPLNDPERFLQIRNSRVYQTPPPPPLG